MTAKQAVIGRDAILGFKDSNIGRVHVEEFGGDVCVATLSAAEADSIRTLGEDGTPVIVGMVILGACDENGDRLFTVADAEVLKAKPGSAMSKIANAVLDHNGLKSSAVVEAKNGSSGTANADSASD